MVKKFLNENLISILSWIAAAFVLGGWIWALVALPLVGAREPGVPLILHFDDLRGITVVGGLDAIIFAGIFGLVVVGMNFAIAREFELRAGGVNGEGGAGGRFFGRFLAVMTLAFAILLFIAFAAIINVNI